MAKEIERKFLLAEGASIPIPKKFVKLNIRQGYLLAEKDKQVRVRIYSNPNGEYNANLGIKFTSSLVRDEFEYAIPVEDALEMYNKAELILEKRRLSFRNKSYHYDIDSYPNGMQVIEVEFKSLKEMEKWVKPSWLGDEITGDSKYSNIILAKQKLKF